MERRGFLKLLGAAVAVPILVQAGAIDAPVSPKDQIVLPSGSVVDTLETARTLGEATAGVAPPDEWAWRERYRQHVRDEIEAEEYERITFVTEVEAAGQYSIDFLAHDVAGFYELSAPMIQRRYSRMMVEDASRLPRGVAHIVAKKIGAAVERDVLAQMLTIQAKA